MLLDGLQRRIRVRVELHTMGRAVIGAGKALHGAGAKDGLGYVAVYLKPALGRAGSTPRALLVGASVDAHFLPRVRARRRPRGF